MKTYAVTKFITFGIIIIAAIRSWQQWTLLGDTHDMWVIQYFVSGGTALLS